MDWPLPWSSRTLRLTSLASRAIPASTSGGLTWRSWTRGTSGLAGSKTRSTTRSSVPRGHPLGQAAGDDAGHVGAVAEAVDQGAAQLRVARPGEVAVQAGHVALEGLVTAEVVVVGVDAGVQHRPGDAAAAGVEGASGRVGLDGGAGGVDQRVDREVGPDPVVGPPRGVLLALVGLDQAQDLVLGELAAEVGVGHPVRLGGVGQGGLVVVE